MPGAAPARLRALPERVVDDVDQQLGLFLVEAGPELEGLVEHPGEQVLEREGHTVADPDRDRTAVAELQGPLEAEPDPPRAVLGLPPVERDVAHVGKGDVVDEIEFSVSYDPDADEYVLVVDGNTLTTVPQDERDGPYLIIRVSSVDKNDARVVVDDLAVDGVEIDASADSRGSDSVDLVDYLILESDGFPDGFTLTGTMTFSWSGNRKKPGSAHSKVEIAWGNVDD